MVGNVPVEAGLWSTSKALTVELEALANASRCVVDSTDESIGDIIVIFIRDEDGASVVGVQSQLRGYLLWKYSWYIQWSLGHYKLSYLSTRRANVNGIQIPVASVLWKGVCNCNATMIAAEYVGNSDIICTC